jgi:hypothetical protein
LCRKEATDLQPAWLIALTRFTPLRFIDRAVDGKRLWSFKNACAFLASILSSASVVGCCSLEVCFVLGDGADWQRTLPREA